MRPRSAVGIMVPDPGERDGDCSLWERVPKLDPRMGAGSSVAGVPLRLSRTKHRAQNPGALGWNEPVPCATPSLRSRSCWLC
jgi:hypothetical protein